MKFMRIRSCQVIFGPLKSHFVTFAILKYGGSSLFLFTSIFIFFYLSCFVLLFLFFLFVFFIRLIFCLFFLFITIIIIINFFCFDMFLFSFFIFFCKQTIKMISYEPLCKEQVKFYLFADSEDSDEEAHNGGHIWIHTVFPGFDFSI